MEFFSFKYFKNIDIWIQILSSIYGTSDNALETKVIITGQSDQVELFKRDSIKCDISARKIQNTKLRFQCGNVNISISSTNQLFVPLCQDFCSTSLNLNNGSWNNGRAIMNIDPEYIYSDRPSFNQLNFTCDNSTVFNNTNSTLYNSSMALNYLDTISSNDTTQLNASSVVYNGQCCRILPSLANTSIVRDTSCDCPVDRSGATCSTSKKINCQVIKTVPDLNCTVGNCQRFTNKGIIHLDYYINCYNNPNMSLVNREGFSYYTKSDTVHQTNLVSLVDKSKIENSVNGMESHPYVRFRSHSIHCCG
eukprot:NODE_298_length_10484_cov_0.802600.p6 type:complete len:307 gc:universal NODE_298_length_10484_cov_0.802600:2111-1191(-)